MKKHVVLLFILFFSAIPFFVKAMTISPPRVEYNVKPGDVIEDSFVAINESDSDNTFIISFDNVTAGEDEEGTPNFTGDLDAPTGLVQWLTVNKDPMVLKARGQYNFPFTIKVPTDAQPGGHYGVICIGEAKGRENGVIMPAVIGDVCALIMMNVEGDVIVDGKIAEFSTDKEFYSSLPVNFLTRFKNNGTIYLKPVGQIIIKNIFGMTVAKIDFNKDQFGGYNVLPQAIRRIPTIWQKTEVPNDASEFTKEYKNFGMGLYTAELNINYGMQEKQSISSIVKFWVFPWQIILVVLAVIMILSFAFRQYTKSVVRRMLKSEELLKNKEQ